MSDDFGRASWALTLLLVLGHAVSASRAGEAPSQAFDVAAVIQQVHFAWRGSGDSWRADHSTWRAEVSPQALRFSPSGRGGGDFVSFGVSSVRRGPAESKPEWAASRGSRGELRVERGDWLETYANGAEGVEQQWHFAAEPAGHGPLEVSFPVSAPLVAESQAGLHFHAGDGLVKYGHATWVDASGHRTSVRARFEHGAIQLSVPEAVLESSTYPAVLDPLIGPEFAVDEPVYAASTDEASRPAVATDGSTFLVVWRDARDGEGNDRIYAARVLATGELLDPAGFSLSTPLTAPGTDPHVTWNGSSYLVAWSSALSTAYVSRVDANALVLDPQPRVIGNGEVESVASDGANFLVTWTSASPDGGASSSVFATRVAASGGSLDLVPIPVGQGVGSTTAWNGATYLIAWRGPTSLRVACLSPEGALLDPGVVLGPVSYSGNYYLSAASNGQDFIVVWRSFGANTVGDISAVRVSAAGLPLDPVPFAVSAREDEETQPLVQWDATNYLVVWKKQPPASNDPVPHGLLAARVSNAGTVLDSTPVVVATGPAHEPSPFTEGRQHGLACTVGACLVAYYAMPWSLAGPAAPRGLFGVRLGPGATVLDPIPFRLSLAANSERAPAVSWNGSHYLLAWEDSRSGEGTDLYGVRVQPPGLVLDPTGIPLSTAPGNQRRPRIASNGSAWLVTWQDDLDGGAPPQARAARVSSAGTVLDPNGISVSSSTALAPDVASRGSDFLVAWRGTNGSVSARRLDGTGVVLDATDLLVDSAASAVTSPVAVGSNGTDWSVAWAGASSSGAPEVRAARVSASGAVLAPGGVLIGPGHSPAIASDGTDFLITRQRSAELVGTHFPLDGSGDFVIGTGVADAGAASVSFGAGSYVVAWTGAALNEYAVRSGRVSTSGVAVDGPSGVLLGLASQVPPSPAVSCGGAQCVLASSRYDDSQHVPRVFGRPLVPNTAPVVSARSGSTPEDVPSTWVLSGFDVDGDALTFRIVQPPVHGRLVDVPPNAVRYEPASDFHGPDGFRFVANDRLVDSAPADVAITVTPVNDVPVATALELTTPEDTPLELTLSAADLDGEPLSFRILTAPQHGTFTGTPPALTYQPEADFHGEDSFTWVAVDATSESAQATVALTVTPVNDAPTASGQSVATTEDTPLTIQLAGDDVDGDSLTFDVVDQPAHGTLSGAPPRLRYLPASHYVGEDSLSFQVSDGQAWSTKARVTITVASAPDAGSPDPTPSVPSGGCGCTTVFDGSPALLLAWLAFRRRGRSQPSRSTADATARGSKP